MQDLRLVGVHEDGEHLLLAAADGARYRVAVDAALREAVRRERPGGDGPSADARSEPMRPREVQSLLRAGAGLDEVCERSGWSMEKVRRYEPPIRAERDYVAGLAQAVQLRGRGSGQEATTLGARVAQRLVQRGVPEERVSWDAWKTDEHEWTVVVLFPAGGRERRAGWRFSPTDRTLSATDDEARWLGEDEQAAGPIPAPSAAGRSSRVYDVEAEGGLDGPVDLESARPVRAGSRARAGTSPTATPVAPEEMPEQARPVEPLRLAGGEPPLGSHPRPEELLGHGPGARDGADEDETAELPTGGHDEPADAPEAEGDLFEDLQEVAGSRQARAEDDRGRARRARRRRAQRRSSAPQSTPPPAEDDARDLDAPEEAHELSAGDDRTAAADRGALPPEDLPQNGSEQDGPEHGPGTPAADDPAGWDEDRDDEPEPQPVPRVVPERPSGRRGRPSVPSWDDIMFGSRGRDG